MEGTRFRTLQFGFDSQTSSEALFLCFRKHFEINELRLETTINCFQFGDYFDFMEW